MALSVNEFYRQMDHIVFKGYSHAQIHIYWQEPTPGLCAAPNFPLEPVHAEIAHRVISDLLIN